MKYIIFTYSGEGLPIAEKLQAEGNDVVVGQIEDIKEIALPEESKNLPPEKPEDKAARLSLYNGILEKYPAEKVAKNLVKLKNRSDYFVFNDFNHNFKYGELLKDSGLAGNWPLAEDRRLETDRTAAKDIIAENYPEIKKIEKREYKSSYDFMQEADDLFDGERSWVLKPNSDSAKTKVPDARDAEGAKEEIIDALESNQKGYEEEGFCLEQMIPDAIEITPQRVYWNGAPLYDSADIEAKRIGSEDGPMSGCAADFVFPIDAKSRLSQIAFPKWADERARGRKGLYIWDLSLIIDPRTGAIYPGEFCPNRLGYNSFYTELAMQEFVSDWFEAVSSGKNPMNGAKKFGASVRMFQAAEKGKKSGIGLSLDEFLLPNLWLIDCRKGKDGSMETAGYVWDTGVATGAASDQEMAVSEAYMNSKGARFEGKLLGRSRADYLARDGGDNILSRYDYLLQNNLL